VELRADSARRAWCLSIINALEEAQIACFQRGIGTFTGRKGISSPFEIDRQENTKFAADSVHFGAPSRYTSYFYSTVVPVAFIDPQREIEGGTQISARGARNS
jgi:hypothetical protein